MKWNLILPRKCTMKGNLILVHNGYCRMRIGRCGNWGHCLQDLLHFTGSHIHSRSHGMCWVWDIIPVSTGQISTMQRSYIIMGTWSHGWRLLWPSTDHTGQSTSSTTTPILDVANWVIERRNGGERQQWLLFPTHPILKGTVSQPAQERWCFDLCELHTLLASPHCLFFLASDSI